MSIAWAWASISIAWSTPTFHSSCSIFFVMACAAVGPPASSCATSNALARAESQSWLKKPQASPSSALIERPVYRSSEARPWPMMRGRTAQAPMSQPARPTRTNRNATLAPGAA
jgi:hypothetical protein